MSKIKMGWAEVDITPNQKISLAEKDVNKAKDYFADKVMCQHYIISYGDNSKVIKDFCNIAGIEII